MGEYRFANEARTETYDDEYTLRSERKNKIWIQHLQKYGIGTSKENVTGKTLNMTDKSAPKARGARKKELSNSKGTSIIDEQIQAHWDDINRLSTILNNLQNDGNDRSTQQSIEYRIDYLVKIDRRNTLTPKNKPNSGHVNRKKTIKASPDSSNPIQKSNSWALTKSKSDMNNGHQKTFLSTATIDDFLKWANDKQEEIIAIIELSRS